MHEDAGTNVVWSGVFDWGDWDAREGRGGPHRQDRRAPLPPLQLDAARVRRARSSSTSRAPASGRSTATTRCPASARSGWRRRSRTGIDKLRFVTQRHRRRLRQQDLPAPVLRHALPARAEAEPAGAVDRVAHRPAHGERARQRALVPRHRGRGQVGRDDARLQRQGARRLRRLPALRAARLHHLGAGDPGLLRLAEHPRRLHAGDDEQVAGVAEPRLLAHAAPLADRADHRHRRRRARARPGRDAQAQLRQDRADAVRDAERLRLRLRRLRPLPRHRARADRLRLARGAAGGGGVARASCSASGSARRSTPARTTSASRSSSTRSSSSRATTRRRPSSSTSSARSSSRSAPSRRARATRRRRRRSSPTSSAARPTRCTCGPATTRSSTRTRASRAPTRASSRSPGSAP